MEINDYIDYLFPSGRLFPTILLSYFNKDPQFPRRLVSSHLHTQCHLPNRYI